MTYISKIVSIVYPKINIAKHGPSANKILLGLQDLMIVFNFMFSNKITGYIYRTIFERIKRLR